MNEENLPIPSEELPPIEMVKVNVDGSTFLTTLSPKFKLSKPYKINEPDKITAFIPGIIINVLVKKNQVVRKGDKLLILMAMKMNNHIRAPLSLIHI